jgi:hypothetical protein
MTPSQVASLPSSYTHHFHGWTGSNGACVGVSYNYDRISPSSGLMTIHCVTQPTSSDTHIILDVSALMSGLGHTAWADAVCALVLAGETLVWWYMVRRNVEVGLWPDLRPYTVTIPKCWWGFLILFEKVFVAQLTVSPHTRPLRRCSGCVR